MCTLSWVRDAAGYTLFFNRDERRTRQIAEPPGVGETAGTRWLAPRDPQGGGTWLGVNEHGVTTCLLNRYDAAPAGRTSRGLLVASLLDCASPHDVRARVCSANLGQYAPFTLVTFAPSRAAHVLSWSGRVLTTGTIEKGGLVLTSSAVAAGLVTRVRAAAFEGAGAHAEALAVLHRSHAPAASAVSICMHRDDAETVSLCRVDVDAVRVRLAYAPGPPCGQRPAHTLALPRAGTAAAVA